MSRDNGYAAEARIQSPFHVIGIMGHWKKDGMCKAADVAAHIKRRMAEQDKEDDNSEMLQLIWINFRAIQLVSWTAVVCEENSLV
jgi:hypothetical protein